MKVDFNNLRKKLVCAYDRLSMVLESQRKGQEFYISVIELKEYMDDLQILIVMVACCYDEKAGIEDVLGDRVLKEFAQEEL